MHLRKSDTTPLSLSLSTQDDKTDFRYAHTQVGKAFGSHQTIGGAVRQAGPDHRRSSMKEEADLSHVHCHLLLFNTHTVMLTCLVS